jgi:hypothetical protein
MERTDASDGRELDRKNDRTALSATTVNQLIVSSVFSLGEISFIGLAKLAPSESSVLVLRAAQLLILHHTTT